MKKASIFLSALMALSMAGCREVPEDVKSRAEVQQGITSSILSSDDASGTPVAEKIGNITFECKPDPIETEEIYILKSQKLIDCTNEENYNHLMDKLKRSAKDLIGIEIPDDEINIEIYNFYDEEKHKSTDRDIGAVIDHYNKDVLARLFETSDTFQFWSHAKTIGDPYDYGERTVYDPDDYPDTVFDMNDGSKMTIKQAIEQADEIINKINENDILDENVTLELSRIAVHKTGNDNVIKLWYKKKIFGLYMNYDGNMLTECLNGTPTLADDFSIRFSYVDISLYGDREFLSITNMFSDTIVEKEKVDTIMSYENAKERVGTGLAKNLTYTVTEAGLRYVSFFNQRDEYHIYRPMWSFVLDDPAEKLTTQPDNYDPSNDYPRVMAYVDAINGDLYYCDPFTNLLEVERME